MDELPKTPPGMSQEVASGGRSPWHVLSQCTAGASVIILRCGQEGSAVAAAVPCPRETWPCHPSPAVALCRRGTSSPAPATTSLGDLTRGAYPLPHPCCTPAGGPVQVSPHLPPSLPPALPGSLHGHFHLLLPLGLALATVPLRHTFHSSLLTGGGDTRIFLAATAGPEKRPMVHEPESTFCCC